MLPSGMPAIAQARAPLPAMTPAQASGQPFAADLARALVLLRPGPTTAATRTLAEASVPTQATHAPIAFAGIVGGLPLRHPARRATKRGGNGDSHHRNQHGRNDHEANHD